MRYTTSTACRAAGVTYHLTPVPVWEAQCDAATYRPESFDQDGFIHCTNGLEELMAVGNRYYQEDSRPFIILILQVDKIQPPVRYDDPAEVFPHIYGLLNVDAVTGMIPAQRDVDGSFLPFSRS